jgi:hypothetical protein
MDHARRHPAAQIESDGLVRYHGLPDGSIGTLDVSFPMLTTLLCRESPFLALATRESNSLQHQLPLS